MGAQQSLQRLSEEVVNCRLCPRLCAYIEHVGRTKVKRHINEEYWAKPLRSFGDPDARLLIIGLAPAAHGGNRTGRMFTGDSSGDWLFRALHETGFASQPTSKDKDDGLVLRQAYITGAVRCAPPGNKPLRSELHNCSRYLDAEIKLLANVRVVVVLGRIAFGAYCRAAKLRGLYFSHGARHDLGKQVLLCSYHPSRQNTNTQRLSWPMWISIFRQARNHVGSGEGLVSRS